SPETNSSRHFSITDGKSSGWNAACQPQPCDSSGERPVYSCHRLLRNSFGPSGRLHQASVGIVSITCRSLASDFCTWSSAFLRAAARAAASTAQASSLFDLQHAREIGPSCAAHSPALGVELAALFQLARCSSLAASACRLTLNRQHHISSPRLCCV